MTIEGESIMLPAKFARFASRVCRIAQKVFSVSDTDNANSVADTSAGSDSTYSTRPDSDYHSAPIYSYSNIQVNSSSSSLSSSSENDSLSSYVGKTARKSHIFRNMILAIIVTFATIVTMLIVPPLKEANAANVAWDYIGNGYISPDSVASHDVYRDFDVQPPDIDTITINGKKKTTITWNVLFNANGCRLKKIENPNAVCTSDNFQHAYSGRPDFYLILPKNIKDNTIRITRYRTKAILGIGGNKFAWELRGKDQVPSDFNNVFSNSTRIPGDPDYDSFWKDSIERCGLGTDATCEVDTWRRAGNFGRLFKSWEQDNDADSIRWIVTAEVEDGVDPYKLPFMAGWISYTGDKHKFTVFGPYDHDGDGIPDLEEFKFGLNPKNNDDIQFPKKSKNDAVYGKVTSVKPYINTGEWVGNSYSGDFKYYKDMPNQGIRTTSEVIPTDAGIEFTFKKTSFGTKEELPDGVTRVNNPNNMKPGEAYINPKTGEVKYSPKPSDRGKTIHFDVQINYPDPRPNNCKMNNSIVKVKGVDIHVVSQASLYNPYYDTTTVKAGEGKDSNSPRDRGGKAFPSGTRFRAETYNKYQNPPTWAKIKNESTGVVTFHPNKWVPASKPNQPENRPVVVYYPDGSTSKDPDSGNNGNPVNAPVIVTRDASESGDLQLHIHKNQNGQEIDYTNGFVFRKNRDVTPQPWIDSWSVREPGDISIRSVCADTTNPMSLKYHLNGINGIKIEGDTPWQHATDEEQEKCRNGQGCAANKLFDSTGNTMERTRGHIKGKPTKIGNYQCTVYALKPNALKRFEEAKKKDSKIESSDGSATNIINTNTFNGLREGVDYTSRTVPIKVHSDAHYYNPQYTKVSVQAGNTEGVMNAAPVSQTGANGVAADNQSQKDLVQDGTYLPKGTWFELKKYSKHKDSREKPVWSNFEGDQSNKKNGSNEAKDKTTDKRYGKITFKPEKTTEARDYLVPVIVHYPDGSTSEDSDSGNLGKPIYAPVSVTLTEVADDDLKLKVYDSETHGGRLIKDNDKNGVRFRKGETLGDGSNDTKPMFFDSWSSKKQGTIYQRMLCYKKNRETGKPESYELDGINGLKLAGRKNVKDGDLVNAVGGKTSQWKIATEQQKKDCKDKKQCDTKHYLYGNENDTTARTWGWLHGKVKDNGDFVCTVYAIKELKYNGKNGELQKKFDTAVNDFVKKPGDRKFEDVVKRVLTDKQDKTNPQNSTQRHVDWDSVTFPIHVHSDAHYYNPKYETITMEAGTKKTSERPKSARDANKAKLNQSEVQEGELPEGTWFEFKMYKGYAHKPPLSYSFFEDGQNNTDNNNSAKSKDGLYGKVTFRPHKWFPATSENNPDQTPVVVHYPDGSTSEDSDSGNNGKPVFASVNVLRSHDEDANNLHLNVSDREGGGNWNDPTINLSKNEELTVNNSKGRWLDSWSQYKPGKINLRTICYRNNPDGTKSHYQSGGIAGITMQNVEKWDHTENPEKQKKCEENSNECEVKHLYDDYISNGNSQKTTERTRGWIKGTAKETGDYECVVYAIKEKQFSKDTNNLLTNFDNAVKKLNKDASKNNTDPLKDFQWNISGSGNNIVKAKKGVDYESRTIPIHIHTQAHNYNPAYDKVNVRAGDEVQSGLPKNKKPTGKHVNTKSLAYGAISDSVSFPDGTWFELKKDDGSAASSSEDAYDWSFWKNGQKDSNAPRDNNNPLNHNGNDTGIGAGSRYGNVTFHPDVTVTPKDHYKTHVVVHYPDGSTSEDPDAGNNQFKHDDNATNTMNPVYAPVKVTDLGYSGNDLRMSLTKSKDTNSVLNGSNDLTVMKGIGLIRNPFVQAWSVKNKTKIHLRMMCSKDNTNKWSRGLEDTLNMHLGHDYGENTPEWTFATESQQKDCRENGNCSADHVLYGMLNANNTQAGSVESSTARREEEIEGAPKETGTYVCSVFALKDNALTAFNQAVKDGIPQNDGSYSSTDMWNVKLAGVAQSRDWDRISFKVHVVEQFKLPKTGGEACVNWNMLMSVLCVIGTGAMAAGFFLEQTKWGRAMLDALLRKTLIKDFICKTAKKLRALRRRSERWRC